MGKVGPLGVSGFKIGQGFVHDLFFAQTLLVLRGAICNVYSLKWLYIKFFAYFFVYFLLFISIFAALYGFLSRPGLSAPGFCTQTGPGYGFWACRD